MLTFMLRQCSYLASQYE